MLATAVTVASRRIVCHFGKNARTPVAKYDAGLPLRKLQAVDISAIGETEAI